MTLKRSRQSTAGFSLVELVLALGLLGTALVSVAGMFVLGARQVHSARAATEALSVATSVLEEIEGWGFRQTWTAFGRDGRAPSYGLDSRVEPAAAKWQATLESMLFDPHAEIAIESLAPTAPPPLDTTRAVRVTVTVYWSEGARARKVSLVSVRT